MKEKHLTMVFTLVLTLLQAGYADNATAAEARKFEQQYLEVADMSDFEPVPVVPNEDVIYHRAYKLKGKNFEIRFRYDPMQKLLAQYKESKKPGSNMTMVPPNNIYPAMYQAILYNIFQTEAAQQIGAFPEEAVKAEFNADAGLTSFGEGKSQFLGKYRSALTYVIHRQDVGQVYVFMLFNDAKESLPFTQKYFYSVRFRPE